MKKILNKFRDGIVFGIGFLLVIGLVNAWTGLQASNGDTLTADKWNELINKVEGVFTDGGGNVGIGTTTPSVKLDIVGDVKVTGSIIPDGFMETNGVIHSTSEKPATSHTAAGKICASSGAHICDKIEYTQAGLGVSGQIWWNGNNSYNHTNGCLLRSCSVGSTVEDGNVLYDITDCVDRCSRTLNYYCCY